MSTPPLNRIVYASRATARCRVNLSGNLEQILAASIRSNRSKGITGLLIAHRGGFLQVLEGAPQEVHHLMQHIRTDRRHRDVVLLGEWAVQSREFGLWSMCARQLTPADALILGELDRRPDFKPASFPIDVVMSVLRTIAGVHEAAFTQQQGVAAA